MDRKAGTQIVQAGLMAGITVITPDASREANSAICDRHSGRAAWRSAEGFSPHAAAGELLTSRACSELRASGPMASRQIQQLIIVPSENVVVRR
jgi:hypothetical protein